MIKHPFKKLVSIALSAVMIMGMSVTALASSPQTDGYHTSILTDNSSVRISQTSDDNFTYIATYDKSTGTIQLTQTSNTTGAQKVGDIAPIKPQTRASLEEKLSLTMSMKSLTVVLILGNSDVRETTPLTGSTLRQKRPAKIALT